MKVTGPPRAVIRDAMSWGTKLGEELATRDIWGDGFSYGRGLKEDAIGKRSKES